MNREDRLLKVEQEQIEVCRKNGVEYQRFDFDLKLGVSDNFSFGVLPLNGLRHPQEGDTCGWYLWADEFSEADDFFKPMHAYHLLEQCPDILKYLALPAGWRFLLAGSHQDVWFDKKLLEISRW